MKNYDSLRLKNQVCFPLYALSREVIKLYTPILSKHKLTYTQYVTMMGMWEKDKILFKELGEILHLDSGTLTPVIKKLEEMGYLSKHRNAEDDRTVTVQLTDKGRKIQDALLEVPAQVACQLKGSDTQLIQLKALLNQLLQENFTNTKRNEKKGESNEFL